jgi:broad specificity phosphatase PhoE
MKRWIFLFRHGETDFNKEQRFQGHLDIPLNEAGREQARALISPLRRLGVNRLLSSDLSRAVETASIVAKKLQIPVVTNPALREAHLGEAQGLTIEEIETQFGKSLVEKWRSPYVSDADVSYPGGETGQEVLNRVTEALKKFMKESGETRVGVATHGGVIRRVVRFLLEDERYFIPIPNGIIYPIHQSTDDDSLHLSRTSPIFLE